MVLWNDRQNRSTLIAPGTLSAAGWLLVKTGGFTFFVKGGLSLQKVG